MLSDTLFDGIHGVVKDIAHYAVDDVTDRYLWYTPEQYDEIVRRLTPLLDAQIAYDTGSDMLPMDRETEEKLSWRIVEMIVDEIQSRYGCVE